LERVRVRGTCVRKPLGNRVVENAIGLALSIVLVGYLAVALLFPERF
jgi:K+-transporting ATPase KdpF subunit